MRYQIPTGSFRFSLSKTNRTVSAQIYLKKFTFHKATQHDTSEWMKSRAITKFYEYDIESWEGGWNFLNFCDFKKLKIKILTIL